MEKKLVYITLTFSNGILQNLRINKIDDDITKYSDKKQIVFDPITNLTKICEQYILSVFKEEDY